MDSFDLFRQLTTGVKFTKRTATKSQHLSVPVKQLKLDPETVLKSTESDEELLPEKPQELTHDDDEDVDVDDDDDDAATVKSESDVADDDIEFEYLTGGQAETQKSKKTQKPKKLTAEEREKLLEEQMINTLRKEYRITVLGKHIPAPITSFEELRTKYNVHERLVQNLLANNYPQPTPIQMQAIPIMLKGRPLMACAPTGSGKTIAFLTPIINDLRQPQKVGFRAIVLAPTRELAQQIYRECVRLAEKTALRIHFISKVSQAKQKFGPDSNHKCDILISTPNRIRFLLQQQPPLLNLSNIEWFVLDEADRLMEDGQNNFKEQLDDILAACTNPNKKLALFSATYTVPVAKWALRHLKHLARVTVGQQNTATESVQQELQYVGAESGKLIAMRNLVHEGLKPPVLIFVQSKERAKQLFEELLYDGINVDVIHADRTQQQRDNCVRAFREGHIWVLICTELMGRGIDFKGVNLVINYDFPPTTISYIHRIGRTGRAGRAGRAITFFTQEDTPNLRSIAHIIRNSGGKVPDYTLVMKKTRKTESKRLAQHAPKREDISTKLRPPKQTETDAVNKKQTKAQKILEKPTNKLQKLQKNTNLKLNSKQQKSSKQLKSKTIAKKRQKLST